MSMPVAAVVKEEKAISRYSYTDVVDQRRRYNMALLTSPERGLVKSTANPAFRFLLNYPNKATRQAAKHKLNTDDNARGSTRVRTCSDSEEVERGSGPQLHTYVSLVSSKSRVKQLTR
jgi:hypothetical protein